MIITYLISYFIMQSFWLMLTNVVALFFLIFFVILEGL